MAKIDSEIAAVQHLAHALVLAAQFSKSRLFSGPDTMTLHALITRFNGPTAPLEVVASEFFGLGRDKAYKYASLHRLPVPTFRCTDSNKAPLLVHVDDLASLLDARHAKARADWDHSQVK